MTIEDPGPEALEGVDWEALDRLVERARALQRTGLLTQGRFTELWSDGLKATGNRSELLETLAMFRP